MNNKHVLITGGSAGIGKATAIALASHGFHVHITGRNEEKTSNALKDIIRESGSEKVDYFIAELSEMNDVRKLASEVLTKLDRLDVLINNAGGVNQKRTENSEGIEKTFATNHLAYFLLTNLLLALIKKSAPARIINVSSDAHYSGRFDPSNLQLQKNYSVLRAYSNTKLFNVLFTYELARRLEGTGVTSNALHPGVVDTRIGNKGTNLVSSLGWTFMTLTRGMSVEKGAATPVYLATSKDVEGISGKYFEKCKSKESSAISYHENYAKQLWEISAELTGLNKSETTDASGLHQKQ